jgi:hypothetical protein
MVSVRFVFIFPLLFALVGCHRPLSAPEKVDPIYNDIHSNAERVIRNIEKLEKDLAKAKSDYETAPIRTGQKEDAAEVYFQAQKDYEAAIEKYRYLALKLKSRRLEARSAYNKLFEQGKPWPDEQAYKAYLEQKKLNEASRDWNPDAEIERKIASEEKKKAAAEAAKHSEKHE